jgi:hypothetical protein
MANQVLVDDLAVKMELKNNGIKLRVNTGGRLRGYLQIGRGGLKWFRGKEHTPFYDITLEKFIEQAES